VSTSNLTTTTTPLRNSSRENNPQENVEPVTPRFPDENIVDEDTDIYNQQRDTSSGRDW